MNGRRLDALVTYQEGLGRFPQGVALNKAAGRLATSLNWAEPGAAVPGSSDSAALATGWLTSAFERDTTDMETRYYLGLAALAQGRDRDALGHFEAAQRFAATAAPARLQLARMASRAGDIDAALRWLRALVDAEPGNARAGALEVACLRREKQPSRARERLAHWRALDPTSLLLRYEAVRLGAVDARLWRDLGADSQRVLDLVDQYLALGDFEAALDLLTRAYPAVAAPASEPGAVAPADNPLLAYLSRVRPPEDGRFGQRRLPGGRAPAADLRVPEPAQQLCRAARGARGQSRRWPGDVPARRAAPVRRAVRCGHRGLEPRRGRVPRGHPRSRGTSA